MSLLQSLFSYMWSGVSPPWFVMSPLLVADDEVGIT